jgi:hypothetical protein
MWHVIMNQPVHTPHSVLGFPGLKISVAGSNLGMQSTILTMRMFTAFLNHSREMLGHYTPWATTVSFHILIHSLLANNSTIQSCNVWDRPREEAVT